MNGAPKLELPRRASSLNADRRGGLPRVGGWGRAVLAEGARPRWVVAAEEGIVIFRLALVTVPVSDVDRANAF